MSKANPGPVGLLPLSRATGVCRGVELVQPGARGPLPTEAHTVPGEQLHAGAAGHWEGLGRGAASKQLHAYARSFSPVYEKQLAAAQSRKCYNQA